MFHFFASCDSICCVLHSPRLQGLNLNSTQVHFGWDVYAKWVLHNKCNTAFTNTLTCSTLNMSRPSYGDFSLSFIAVCLHQGKQICKWSEYPNVMLHNKLDGHTFTIHLTHFICCIEDFVHILKTQLRRKQTFTLYLLYALSFHNITLSYWVPRRLCTCYTNISLGVCRG